MTMTEIFILILLAAWLMISVTIFIKNSPKPWLLLLSQLALIGVIVFVMHNYFHFLDSIVSKGPVDLTVVDLFVITLSIVAGLAAQPFYIQIKDAPDAELAKGQRKIQTLPVWKHILITPIILLLFLNMRGLTNDPLAAKMTMYLAAYQTGFFGMIFIRQLQKSAAHDTGVQT